MKRKLFIILQKNYENRADLLIDALKAHNAINIKDIISGEHFNTLQNVLKKDVSWQLKFALVEELFNMLFDDNPDCQAVITTVDYEEIIRVAKAYYDCKPFSIVDGNLKNAAVKSAVEDVKEIRIQGNDYEKIAEDLLSA